MAIDFSQYKQVERGLYQHIKEPTKWLARYRSADGKRKRKIFSVEKDTPTNMRLQAIRVVSELTGTKSANETAIEEVWKAYVKSKRNDWGDETRYGYARCYKKHINPHIGNKAISRVRPVDVSNILNADVSKRTKKRITEILKPLFDYAVANEIIETSPFLPIHRVKRDSIKEKRRVTDAIEKYKKVYAAIMALPDRDKALMLFGFHGRRKGEVLGLRWRDIVGDRYIIIAENNKVDEDMVYTLPQDLKDVLEAMRKDAIGGYVFESPKKPGQPMTDIRDIVYKVRNATGIEEFGYHWMRNLAVTALSQMGVSTIDLSAMLGHTDLNTLQKYLSLEREASTQRTNDATQRLLNGK